MALTVPSGHQHTDAVITALRAAELTVGDASGTGLTAPYVVVYTDLGELDGPLGDRYADLDQTITVHGIGAGREQAQWVADKARAALLSAPVDIDGRDVLYLCPIPGGSQPARRDDAVKPPLFYAVDQYRLATTPAPSRRPPWPP